MQSPSLSYTADMQSPSLSYTADMQSPSLSYTEDVQRQPRHSVDHALWHAENRINGREISLPHQRQSRQAKEGVERIHHVPRAVRKATRLDVL